MGTKIGLTGITFGDATVQNTAATTGVTSLTAGTGISVSGATGAVTVSATGGGTVTSVATGNGLSGGTITSSGTLTLGDVSFNSVGSYGVFTKFSSGQAFPGTTASGSGLGYWSSGTGANSFFEGSTRRAGNVVGTPGAGKAGFNSTTAVSGTWRCMSGTNGGGYSPDDNETVGGQGLWVRVS
jgi:hypothetical protein